LFQRGVFARLQKNLGLTGDDGKAKYRFDDLRHAAAGLLIEQGWPARKLRDHLGEASIATTARRYGDSFTRAGDDRAALALIAERLLGEALAIVREENPFPGTCGRVPLRAVRSVKPGRSVEGFNTGLLMDTIPNVSQNWPLMFATGRMELRLPRASTGPSRRSPFSRKARAASTNVLNVSAEIRSGSPGETFFMSSPLLIFRSVRPAPILGSAPVARSTHSRRHLGSL
ncbi:hypothetical protein LCGC14_2201370, partial [marine sediment metagenome]